jgi:hypothetical protein
MVDRSRWLVDEAIRWPHLMSRMTRTFDLQLTNWLNKTKVLAGRTGGRTVRPDVAELMW